MSKIIKIAIAAFAAMTLTANAQMIERSTKGFLDPGIVIPAGAETFYMSGKGNHAWVEGCKTRDERAAKGDACKPGDMYEQGKAVFESFKAQLDEAGWSLSDVVMLRIYGVPGEDGKVDSGAFNKAYFEYFGEKSTSGNTNLPSRTFVGIHSLVVPGWLVEVEARAIRMPK
ncbi:MAG: Rid family hydrolase [Emcibacteraceae bacterium]|nr:Rid family hydrolase [Emcibacteraceae bacterium]MDG1858398.1 Rid family hydrolase [Emcibacteraceae bacterium]